MESDTTDDLFFRRFEVCVQFMRFLPVGPDSSDRDGTCSKGIPGNVAEPGDWIILGINKKICEVAGKWRQSRE